MSRFVAVLLIDREGTVRAQVDPRTRFCAELGQVRSSALLIQAHRRGRGGEVLSADDELMRELAGAMGEAAGVKAMEDAGLAAWEQRGGSS